MSESTAGSAQFARAANEFMQRISQGMAALANVGDVTIGSATKDAVCSEDKVTLYRYRPSEVLAPELRVRTPLLICYALVNRPYMMDLQADRSLIRGLLQRGVDVYLIDWGYPDGADRYLALEENLLTKWAKHVDVDALVATTGNVPGDMLNALFVSLMPLRLNSQKYVDLLDQLNDPTTSAAALENFLRMEKWIFDSPDQAGEMFRQFFQLFVKDNRLVSGGLEVGGRKVDLKQVAMPVLNIYALQDHLVPPSASKPLQQLVGSGDYSTHEFQGGHIGIYVSRAAQRQIPEKIAGWLRERDRPEARR